MRKRRRRLGEAQHGELTLAALIDVLVNILIFLLTLYGSDPGEASGAKVELADSTATDPVESSVVVVVTEGTVVVGAREPVPFDSLVEDTSALKTVLREEFDKEKADDASTLEEEPPPDLVLQVDRRVTWTQLRPVLAAANQVGFVDLRFVVTTVSDPATP